MPAATHRNGAWVVPAPTTIRSVGLGQAGPTGEPVDREVSADVERARRRHGWRGRRTAEEERAHRGEIAAGADRGATRDEQTAPACLELSIGVERGSQAVDRSRQQSWSNSADDAGRRSDVAALTRTG